MTSRFLLALVVLLSFIEATPPAGAFPVAATFLDMQSRNASGAFILVKKVRGMATLKNAPSGRHRYKANGVPHHSKHSYGIPGFKRKQGFGNYSRFGGGSQNQPNGQN